MGTWTDARVIREILDRKDRLNISYCLRLLREGDLLDMATLHSQTAVNVLGDMARRLFVSPTSLLTQKQTDYAASLLKKARAASMLSTIFNIMEARGEEILLDDADPKWLPALKAGREERTRGRSATRDEADDIPLSAFDREPEPEPSPARRLNPAWGLF